MKLIRLALVLLLTTGCEQTANSSTDTSAANANTASEISSESNDASAKESHDHDHAQGTPLVGLPYDIVESETTCNEPVVMEFFAYHCPHCYKLEPYAKKWKEKNAGKVKFRGVPTHLGRQEFGSFLILHHAAKALGVLDKAAPLLFEQIHTLKKNFASKDEAIGLLVKAGASLDAATKAVDDQASVNKAVDADFKLMAQYKIASVPTILVNHKYQFNVTQAGGYDKVFDMVDETLALPSECNKK